MIYQEIPSVSTTLDAQAGNVFSLDFIIQLVDTVGSGMSPNLNTMRNTEQKKYRNLYEGKNLRFHDKIANAVIMIFFSIKYRVH